MNQKNKYPIQKIAEALTYFYLTGRKKVRVISKYNLNRVTFDKWDKQYGETILLAIQNGEDPLKALTPKVKEKTDNEAVNLNPSPKEVKGSLLYRLQVLAESETSMKVISEAYRVVDASEKSGINIEDDAVAMAELKALFNKPKI